MVLGRIASVFEPFAKVGSISANPATKLGSAVVQKTASDYNRENARKNLIRKREQEMADLSAFGGAGRNIPSAGQGFSNSGLGSTRGFFSDLGSFARDITPIVELTRGSTPSQRSQPAQSTRQRGGQELSTSGAIENIAGLLQPALFGTGAGKVLRDLGVGGAGALLNEGLDLFTSRPSGGRRITRKMKSELMRIYNLSGMDIETTAAIGSALLNIDLDREGVFQILTKKFRNDGSYVTKAAVRNARKTARKLDTLVHLRNELCPPTTVRKRTTRTTSSVSRRK
jgi:hypothetical protein